MNIYISRTHAMAKDRQVCNAFIQILRVGKKEMRAISLLDNFANPLHQLLPDHNASSLMTNPDSLY